MWLQILQHSSHKEVGSMSPLLELEETLCLLWFIKNYRSDATDLRNWVIKGHAVSLLLARIFTMKPWVTMLEVYLPQDHHTGETTYTYSGQQSQLRDPPIIPVRCQTCERRRYSGSGSPDPAIPASSIWDIPSCLRHFRQCETEKSPLPFLNFLLIESTSIIKWMLYYVTKFWRDWLHLTPLSKNEEKRKQTWMTKHKNSPSSQPPKTNNWDPSRREKWDVSNMVFFLR